MVHFCKKSLYSGSYVLGSALAGLQVQGADLLFAKSQQAGGCGGTVGSGLNVPSHREPAPTYKILVSNAIKWVWYKEIE